MPQRRSLAWIVAALAIAAAALLAGTRFFDTPAQRRAPPAPSAPLPSTRPAAAHPPSTAAPLPARRVRRARFDGGTARIALVDGGMQHVVLMSDQGRVVGESWCVPPAESYDAVRAFFTSVRSSILAGARRKVADAMTFPLRVNHASVHTVASREQFLRDYSAIMTPGTVAAVRRADPGQVFCNYLGTMLDGGALWATIRPDHRLGVYAINVQ